LIAELAAAVVFAVGVPAFTGTDAKVSAVLHPHASAIAKPKQQVNEPRALAIAKALPKVAAERRAHPGSHWDTSLQVQRWRVQLWTASGELRAEVFVDRKSGAVLEQWTGYQAAWGMARGYPGAFGHSAAAIWVWLPLLAAFLIGLLPRGRPNRRWLDVVAVAALSVSFAGFNRGRIDLSTPLLYPPMLWLLVSLLWRGFRPPERLPAPRRTLLPASAMIIGIVFLVGFRTALVVADGNVIDVGEASVIGGDRLVSGKQVYGHFPKRIERGDTYGPSTWAAYSPFSLLFDMKSNDGRLAAAATAAVVFDLTCLLLLVLLGYRLRGPPAALAAAWFWVTCPFTLYVEMCGANDGLVAAALTLSLISLTASGTRGGLLRGVTSVVSALTKFAGFALLPMFVRAKGSSNLKAVMAWGVGVALATAVALAPYADNLTAVWSRTIGYQDSRGAPFSAWGLYHLPEWSRTGWELAVLVLALVAAVLPKAKYRDATALAALSAALLIAVQLSAVYWFYTYLIWFIPAIAIVVAVELEPAGVSRWLPGVRPARSGQADPPLPG